MSILTKKPQRTAITRHSARGLSGSYAALGLRVGEARVDAIRQAAFTTAKKISAVAESREELTLGLADVAVSAYRLLDPRKRERRIERIGLAIISELGLDQLQNSRKSLRRFNKV